MKQGRGFTIVELLIVIVVIAILAAISFVAYTGIQERTKETVIRSDLSNFSKAVELYRVEHGSYPGPQNNVDNLRALNFKVSQSAYPKDIAWNFDYCTNRLQGNTQYILAVFLGQRKMLYISSNNSTPKEFTLSEDNPNPAPCYNDSPSSVADDAGLTNILSFPAPGMSGGLSGYGPTGWRDWTK